MNQKYREAANLDFKVTPHSLRHTWASNLARNNSIRAVQQLAGHEFLSSTDVYLHNQPADLVAAVDSLPGRAFSSGLNPIGRDETALRASWWTQRRPTMFDSAGSDAAHSPWQLSFEYGFCPPKTQLSDK